MWVVVLIVVVAVCVYKFGKNSGEVIGKVSHSGGMSVKYERLINNIISSHKGSEVIGETRTYLRVGVSNYGGSTMVHIQQCPNDIVMIDYDVAGNPIFKDFSLRFTFPDSMDQDQMMERIMLGVRNKMIG